MKRIVILILLALPFISPAQDIRYGVKAGLNLANYQGEDNGGRFKAGAYSGLFVNYKFTDMFAIQTELVYSQQGSRDHIDGNSVTTSLDYLTVPVLMQFSLNNFDQFIFVLGPQVGYLLDSKVKTEVGTEHDKSIYEDFDFGIIAGIEYEFSDHFLINTRYYYGLIKFFNQSEVNSGARNFNISIGAAYRF